ncbi:MarR family winged helix-turn-helix transcriptional regulator [Microcella sp.]|uniref:MarR family winged helix-turn-helix transcriptional regulator n=1 Tax=Microcella sp. TaxID=1913979 RepID=UPI003F72D495
MRSADDHGSAAVELWLAARAMSSRIESRLDTQLRTESGISASTYAVLCALRRPDDALSQQAVADGLGLDKSSVSRRIKEAAALGLVSVEPSSSSRRENAVSITAAGIAAIDRGDLLLAELARGVNAAEARELAAALHRLFIDP